MRRRGRGGRGPIGGPPMILLSGAPVQSPELGPRPISLGRSVAQVNSESCTGCGRCVSVCPAQAISLDPAGKATVNTALCQSCGVCAGQCPVQAISLVMPALAK